MYSSSSPLSQSRAVINPIAGRLELVIQMWVRGRGWMMMSLFLPQQRQSWADTATTAAAATAPGWLADVLQSSIHKELLKRRSVHLLKYSRLEDDLRRAQTCSIRVSQWDRAGGQAPSSACSHIPYLYHALLDTFAILGLAYKKEKKCGDKAGHGKKPLYLINIIHGLRWTWHGGGGGGGPSIASYRLYIVLLSYHLNTITYFWLIFRSRLCFISFFFFLPIIDCFCWFCRIPSSENTCLSSLLLLHLDGGWMRMTIISYYLAIACWTILTAIYIDG